MTYPKMKLDPNDYLWWMEEVIEKELGVATQEHADEHSKMMDHWNLVCPTIMPLNGPVVNNEYSYDREYHLLLHLKYWHENNIQKEYVNKFLADGGDFNVIENPKLIGAK